MSDCKVCVNYDDGATVTRVSACYNSIGQVTTMKNIVDKSVITDTAMSDEISTYVSGGTPTAGITITERDCAIKYAHPDFEKCFGDGTDLVAKFRYTEEQDAETGEVAMVTKATVIDSADATLVEGETYTAVASEVVYVSGSTDAGDLNVTINGIALQLMPCIPCNNC